MPESKSGALPLGYAPILCRISADSRRGAGTIPAEKESGNGPPQGSKTGLLAALGCHGYNRALAPESSSAW
jgi:hypothetical protein